MGADVAEVRALMLGLWEDEGVLQHVGIASSFSRAARGELARELAPLVVDDLAGRRRPDREPSSCRVDQLDAPGTAAGAVLRTA